MVKIRIGFVSNSSTTSFTCDVCGETFSGWDGDYGILTYMCENYHNICETDLKKEDITFEDLFKYYKNNKKTIFNWDEDLLKQLKEAIKDKDKDCLLDLLFCDLDELPPEFCPLCTFREISDKDMNTYLMGITKKNYITIKAEMKERFKDYEEFGKFCRDNIP